MRRNRKGLFRGIQIRSQGSTKDISNRCVAQVLEIIERAVLVPDWMISMIHRG
jgi:hypothetical protein